MLPANILQSQLLLFHFSRQVAAVQEKEPPVLVLSCTATQAGIHPRMPKLIWRATCGEAPQRGE